MVTIREPIKAPIPEILIKHPRRKLEYVSNSGKLNELIIAVEFIQAKSEAITTCISLAKIGINPIYGIERTTLNKVANNK